MLKKLNDYCKELELLIQEGAVDAMRLESVRAHISFFQHERLAHELVMMLFAILCVGGIFFYVVFPEWSVLLLDILFFALLIPYIRHYYGLENGVQKLYDLYAQLERQLPITKKVQRLRLLEV
ncbi:MAG: hypothetical protein HUK20_03455 [Fibrobacter sp.]|nr:hypothetical protein [Fibrobacter sp.]